MRYLLLLVFLAVAFAGTIQNYPDSQPSPFDDDSEIELIVDGKEVAPRFILSWQARRAIRRFQKQMPCGFPKYGIPPLAPFKQGEADIHFELGALNTADSFERLRIDGLDNFKINKLKLNMILKKVNFDISFEKIQVTSSQYTTDTIVNLLSELGLSVQYEGDGSLDFSLLGLRIVGTLKYKMPIFWGSIKIKSLKVVVALDGCESNISGILGDGKLNERFNELLEEFIVEGINDNDEAITEQIEKTVVPPVNEWLKGKDFWTIIDWIASGDGGNENDPIQTKCVPPKDPWA